MLNQIQKEIFRAGSRTYFYSALFFPPQVKEEVSILYGFVRLADNYVDSVPQDKNGFYAFRQKYEAAALGKNPSDDQAIDRFVELARRRNFDPKWAEAFLRSMEMDIFKTTYADLKEVEDYIFGSAEVVGLMMARLLGLEEDCFHCARFQGKAMQYVNFIRDINEDLKLGRVYFPQDELKHYGIESLRYEWAAINRKTFGEFIDHQISRYQDWQKKAEEGYHWIPSKYLIPVKTAAEMYNWTAGRIKKDPLLVYRQVLKPSRFRIIRRAGWNKIKSILGSL